MARVRCKRGFVAFCPNRSNLSAPETVPLNLAPVNNMPAPQRVAAMSAPKPAIERIAHIGSLKLLIKANIGGVAMLRPPNTPTAERTNKMG